MNATTKSTKPAIRFVIPVLAGSIVAGSVFFSGLFKRGGAKDIDARYFYVAAKCWAAGKYPQKCDAHKQLAIKESKTTETHAPPDSMA